MLWPAVLLILTACAGVTPPPAPETGLPAPEMAAPPAAAGQSPDSRGLAAYSLIQEAYRLLKNGHADAAIRVLERAVGLNPADGPGYFYLAEAWLQKGNSELAARFNDLARLYLRGDTVWAQRASLQKERIDKGIIDP